MFDYLIVNQDPETQKYTCQVTIAFETELILKPSFGMPFVWESKYLANY